MSVIYIYTHVKCWVEKAKEGEWWECVDEAEKRTQTRREVRSERISATRIFLFRWWLMMYSGGVYEEYSGGLGECVLYLWFGLFVYVRDGKVGEIDRACWKTKVKTREKCTCGSA